jgi:hypothetical protein
VPADHFLIGFFLYFQIQFEVMLQI